MKKEYKSCTVIVYISGSIKDLLDGKVMFNAVCDFLAELYELCEKYGITIGGCGCDGSPWIDVTKCKDVNGLPKDYLDNLEIDLDCKTISVTL